MRIVHILPRLSAGGAERVAVELARHAAHAGHDVTLLLGERAIPSEPLLARLPSSITVSAVAEHGSGRLTWYARGLWWLLVNHRWLRRQEVVHCHLTFGAFLGTLTYFTRKLRGGFLPLVIETYHAVGMNVSVTTQRLHAAMAARRDALVLMANEDPYWREFTGRHPGVVVRTILNGGVPKAIGEVDMEGRLAYRRQVGIPDECELLVGTVGRLHSDRHPWLYVDVFAEIARELGPNVHFLIAGGGPEYDRLTSLVAEKGLAGNVHFTGTVTDPLLPLAVMDLYVTVNVGEVTGVAAIEAALSGRPVVAIQLAKGYRAQPTDWIWSNSDVVETGRHASNLLRDDGARRALANTQQAYAKAHHSVEVMGRAYESLYETLLSART